MRNFGLINSFPNTRIYFVLKIYEDYEETFLDSFSRIIFL